MFLFTNVMMRSSKKYYSFISKKNNTTHPKPEKNKLNITMIFQDFPFVITPCNFTAKVNIIKCILTNKKIQQ